MDIFLIFFFLLFSLNDIWDKSYIADDPPPPAQKKKKKGGGFFLVSWIKSRIFEIWGYKKFWPEFWEDRRRPDSVDYFPADFLLFSAENPHLKKK